MQKFKQFIKTNFKKAPSIPSAINFKFIESIGETPMPIHFKNQMDESVGQFKNYDAWKDTNENRKLGNTNTTIRKKLSAGHNLTDDEKIHITKYTKGSLSLNKNLIHGKEPKEGHGETIRHLDTAIDKHPLQHDVHVYSGLGFDPTDHTDKDGRMHSPAYISTTHDKETAHSFTTAHRGTYHVARISLSKGDPAIHVSQYSDNPHEDETIIKRGVTLQHNGHEDHKDADGNRYRIHNMSVVR